MHIELALDEEPNVSYGSGDVHQHLHMLTACLGISTRILSQFESLLECNFFLNMCACHIVCVEVMATYVE